MLRVEYAGTLQTDAQLPRCSHNQYIIYLTIQSMNMLKLIYFFFLYYISLKT